MKEHQLSEIADIQMGYQTRKKIAGSANSPLFIVMGKDVNQDNELDPGRLARIEWEPGMERYLVKPGDVLFMAKGANNHATCIKTDLSNTLASGSFYILRVKSASVSPCYLAWWLNQSTAQGYFKKTQSSGSTITFMSADALRGTPVYLPNLTTQEQVVRLDEAYRKWKKRTIEMIYYQEQLINQVSIKSVTQKEKA